MKNTKFIAPLFGCVLAACGGGGGGGGDAAAAPPTSASISGTVSGLPGGATLLLNNAGTETIAVTANGRFFFAKRVAEGNTYKVTVSGQPSGTSCEVANGTGTVAHGTDNVSDVSVACKEVATTFIRFNVGVTVSGLLPGNSVTLTNNGTDALLVSENGLFLFPGEYFIEAVYEGRAGGYDVVVKTGPATQSCTISNGTGAVTPPAQDNFINVLVSCK